MKIRLVFFLLIFICYPISSFASSRTDEAKLIIERYHEFLLRTYPTVNLDSLLTDLRSDGRWEHINYGDKEPANWKILNHLRLLSQLSFAWAHPESDYYHSETLWAKISPALDYWLKNGYTSSNWWHNQIGVPRLMRDIIILTRERMTEAQLKGALKVMGQLRVLKPGEGANLIWSADLGFHYAALTNDIVQMNKCHQLLTNEIRIVEDGDGIKPDYSFQQHGPRLQMYQYGEAYFTVSVRLAWQMRNTCWAYPADKIEILSRFVLDGWQWMARGIYTVPGTIDRSTSRVGALASADIRYLIPFLQELSPNYQSDYQQVADIQNGKASLLGFRHYPYSDFTVYHQPEFSFFLKTISTRTLPTESINNENLKGHLLNSGDTYWVRNGKEYYNLIPVWDWEKLPGITNFKNSDHIERSPFVGSLKYKDSGMSVMDYSLVSREGEQKVSAKKIWACHNGWVICLISDLQESAQLSTAPFTVLDQSRLQSDVFCNTSRKPLAEGKHEIVKANWIWHNELLCIFPTPLHLSLTLGDVEGRWSDINYSESKKIIKEKIFLPILSHDTSEIKSFVYAYTSCTKPEKADSLRRNASWHILQNNRECQAIAYEDDVKMIAFYEAGKLQHKKMTVEVDKPSLIIIQKENVIVGDPTGEASQIKVTINGKSRLYRCQ